MTDPGIPRCPEYVRAGERGPRGVADHHRVHRAALSVSEGGGRTLLT